MGKRYCKFCGKEVEKESVVCLSCGRQIEELKSTKDSNSSPFVINNNNNASSSAASSSAGGYSGFRYVPLHIPFYLTVWGFIIIGLFTWGIYWFVWPFLRYFHEKKEKFNREMCYDEYLRSNRTSLKVDVKK